MRRAGPILIALIGVLALIVVLAPGLRVPDASAPDGAWRLIETKLGLDLEGGFRVEYQALEKDGQRPTAESMGVIKDIIERRVNQSGVSEAVVVVQGADRVVVELPGVGDPESIPALRAAAGRALDGRMKRLCKVAAKRIGEKAGKPEEVNALRKQVEGLQQSNQKLEDRLVALEARLDKPSSRRK